MKLKMVFVVNVDWFFISHRLPLALEGLKQMNEVYLISKNTGKFKELERLGIKCFEIDFERSGKNPLKELGLIGKLSKLYVAIKPHIIHHITLKPSIYGTIAAKRCGSNARIINAISGLGYTFTPGRRSMVKIILTLLLKYAFSDKRANFIFQNPDDQAFYRKLGFLTDNNHIIIKGAGVDENVFLPKNNDLAGKKICIVLLARMLKDKGVLEFIQAANLLKNKYENTVEFVLAGGIDNFNPAAISAETLQKLCDEDYIKWIGHQDDVRKIYEHADIVCLPSYREGLPKSLVEAMSVGCPIITTDAIGCRECVEDNVNGFLVPIGNHGILAQRIERLVLDKELRIAMGKNSRKKMLAEMSLSKVITATFNFYAQ